MPICCSFPTKTMYAFFISHIQATCPVHHIILNLLTQILVKECKAPHCAIFFSVLVLSLSWAQINKRLIIKNKIKCFEVFLAFSPCPAEVHQILLHTWKFIFCIIFNKNVGLSIKHFFQYAFNFTRSPRVLLKPVYWRYFYSKSYCPWGCDAI